jgi:hypothetical protein
VTARLLATTAPITIIDAVRDPNIFGRWFRDRESWAAWFCFLKCLFGLPLDDAELEIFRRCTGRDAPIGLGYLLATLIVGRRGGKSIIMALGALLAGCAQYEEYRAAQAGAPKKMIGALRLRQAWRRRAAGPLLECQTNRRNGLPGSSTRFGNSRLAEPRDRMACRRFE